MLKRSTSLFSAAVLLTASLAGIAHAQCADVPPNPKNDIEGAAFGSACVMNAAGTVALVSGPGYDGGDGLVRTFERVNGSWVEGTALGAQLLFGDNYGYCLAMSDDGNTAIVTAPREPVFTPGFFTAAGAAYIIERDTMTGAWAQAQKWNSPSPGMELNFGSSCDMSSDGLTVVIGESNVLGSKQAGLPDAAYVATRVGGVWGDPIELIPSPAPPDSYQFGEQVRISDDGTLIAVSAASPPAFSGESGRVYIFELVAGTWTQTDMLQRPTADSFNSFGKAIGFDGHDLLVANPSEMTPASDLYPTPSIYIYRRTGSAYPANPDETIPYVTGAPIPGGFVVRGDALAVTDSPLSFTPNHGLMRYIRDFDNPDRTWKFDALFVSEASQNNGPTGYGFSAAFADDPEVLVVGEPGWSPSFDTFQNGRINFPDRVFTQGNFAVIDGSSSMFVDFEFPGAGFQSLFVQLLGFFNITFPESCSGEGLPQQIMLSDFTLTPTESEFMLEGPLGIPIVLSDVEISLSGPSEPAPVSPTGEALLTGMVVHIDAMVKVGFLPPAPFAADGAQSGPMPVVMTGGTFGEPLGFFIPNLNLDFEPDIGLGDDNPTVHATGNVFTQITPNCLADLTGDGELDFFDVSAFLFGYTAMDPISDFTGDGLFNFFDVSAFLAAYGAGCP